MADDHFRKHCWLVAFMVTFGMLLSLRGMGLHSLMKPADVRYILVVLLLIGISAILIFIIFCLKNYTRKIIQQGTKTQRDRIKQRTLRRGNYGAMSSVDRMIQRKKRYTVYIGKEKNYSSISYFLSNYSQVLAVYVFGGGSIVLNIFIIFYTSQCLGLYQTPAQLVGLLFGLPEIQDDPADAFDRPDEISRIVTAVVKVIFFSLEIPFLHYLSTITYESQKSKSQYLLLPIMGVNFAVWLYAFLDETKVLKIFTYIYPEEANVQDFHAACINHSTVVEVYTHQVVERVFYPISMEFCLASMEILYHLYFIPRMVSGKFASKDAIEDQEREEVVQRIQHLCTNVDQRIRGIKMELMEDSNLDYHDLDHDSADYESNHAESQSPTTPLLQSASTSTDSSESGFSDKLNLGEHSQFEIIIMVPKPLPMTRQKNVFEKFLCGIMTVLHPCTALIVGLLEATLMKIFTLHVTYDEGFVQMGYINRHFLMIYCKIPVLVVRIIFNCIPLLFATCICVHIFRKFEKRRSNPHGVKWSILLALVGITVLTLFEVGVCAAKLHTPGEISPGEINDHIWLYSLSIIESLLYWPQFFAQSFLVYHGQRRLADTSHPLYKSLQQGLSYLAMNNFIHWGINSFLEIDYLTNRVELADDVKFWDYIVHLGVPTCIYFRYICTFLILEIKHLLHEEEDKVARWQFDMQICPSNNLLEGTVETEKKND